MTCSVACLQIYMRSARVTTIVTSTVTVIAALSLTYINSVRLPLDQLSELLPLQQDTLQQEQHVLVKAPTHSALLVSLCHHICLIQSSRSLFSTTCWGCLPQNMYGSHSPEYLCCYFFVAVHDV